MTKYQLYRATHLNTEGETVHPLLIAEAPDENTLLKKALDMDLNIHQHYLCERTQDGTKWRWNNSYFEFGTFRYLSQFPELARMRQERDERLKSDDIRVSGFIITEPDDRSVGIFGSTYILNGDFVFTDKEGLEEFRTKLREAFEWVSDPLPSIVTFEEQIKFIAMEDQHYSMTRDGKITDDNI